MNKQKQKESLSIMIAKTALAIAVFTGLGTIIFGGGVVIMKYYNGEVNNQIVETADQETENYYDVLEKKCNGDSCCLASFKVMKENKYRKANENGECPEGFDRNMMRCITSYQWCEPVVENLKILLEPKNVALFKKEIPNANNQCVSHPQVVSYSLNTVDDRFSLMKINSRQLEKKQDAIENIINFVEKGEIPKKVIKVSKPSGVVGEKQIVEEERQGVGYLYYDAFHNSCGGFMIDLIGEIEDISYPGADGARAICVWEGQDIPGLIRVRVYAYYKDYVIELSKLVSDEAYLEDYLMNIVKKCEKSSDEECFSKTVASDKILKQKAKETAEELVKLFELDNQPDTSDWQTYRNEEFGFEFQYPDKTGDIKINSSKTSITLTDLIYYESSVFRDPVVYIHIHDYDKQFNNLDEYLNKGKGWDNIQGTEELISIKKVFNNNDLMFFEVIAKVNRYGRGVNYFESKAYYMEYKKTGDNKFIWMMGPYIYDDRFAEIIIDTFKFIER